MLKGFSLRRPIVWVIGLPALALIGYLAFGVFGVQALFINQRVDEAFPAPSGAPSGVGAASMPKFDAMATPSAEMMMDDGMMATPSAEMMMDDGMTDDAMTDDGMTDDTAAAGQAADRATAAPTATPTAAPTAAPTATPEPTAEPTPAGPVLITSGEFHNVFHSGTGTALIYRQPDGSYLLRLENLNVDNGPDLYVYAVAAPDSFDEQTVLNAGFVNVGRLKGNQGNQNYALPADFDPSVHRSISIWCKRFTVNFVTAPLN